MKGNNFLVSLACGALVLAAACQDDPVAYDGDLTPSFAQVHLKGGKKAAPTFTDLGIVLEASGALSGLGAEDIVITLDATADVVSVCQNNGGNQSPGQNPAPINVSGAESIPGEKLKNGHVSFSLTTVAPETPIPGAPDCPNANWDEFIVDLAFTSANITVEQPAGTAVFTMTYAPIPF